MDNIKHCKCDNSYDKMLAIVEEVIVEHNSDKILLSDFNCIEMLNILNSIGEDAFHDYVEEVVIKYEQGDSNF